MNAVIIDDEPEAIRGMSSLLELFCPEIHLIGMAKSVKEGISTIMKLEPDLVFLDVQLKDGNGFDLLAGILQRNFHTIFVTAHDRYAIKALRFNAMDYLLKPVDPEELVQAVNRAKQSEQPNYTYLLEGAESGNFDRIAVPDSKGTNYIALKQIFRLEASNNYTYIHLLNDKPRLVSKTIKSFEELLPEDVFIRCHQSHIVNIQYVVSFERTENAQLTLQDKTIIPVSRAKRSGIEAALVKRYPSL
jgi:two-component system LytT family response regulator